MLLPRLRLAWLLLLLALAAPVRAGLAADLPDDWFARPPTPERIKAVQAAAAEGWQPLAARIYAGSLRAYELRQEEDAASWYYVARWCDLLGKSQKALGRQWLEAAAEAGELHANINRERVAAMPDEPVGRLITPETSAWLLADRDFAESFFRLLDRHDLVPEVIAILQALREHDARAVADYPQLALAIALVYDVPPPPYWPHWQVSPEVLPRRLPSPVQAFKFFTEADKAGRTLHKLVTVSAGELIFMVDLAAPFSELSWAQQSVKYPLADLVKSYESVRYRKDRIDTQAYMWPGKRYDLLEIYKQGGICVDQAYFATQAAKARGVPSLLFSGSGRDGRHAWFGYLGAAKKWVLDAGRYEAQRYVTGAAFDPQTWTQLSDHELIFLSEGFRRLQAFRQSQQHLVFADLYLRLGNKTAAAAAARKAVNYERRNVPAWDLLIAASDEAPVATREALLREAAMAMQRYPDLNGRYVTLLAESLRARGAVTQAEFEERSLVRRGQIKGRTDVGIDLAVKTMEAAAPAEQLRVYKQMLQQYGQNAGIEFYDRVTKPLLLQMIAEKRRAEAQQIIAQTRAVLKPEFESQFDVELTEMAAKAKK
jgi:hypothetical protein